MSRRCACQIYGMTETYGNCAVADAADPAELRATTVGAPLAGQRIRIADPETGRTLATGETGEIRVKGHVMLGYYRDPERTAAAFDADGWLLTGDLGFLGADGRLRFRGRIKEMVKTAASTSPLPRWRRCWRAPGGGAGLRGGPARSGAR